eukprot:TRINITY_DN4074_c0_g1_i1.p1 TRINITY_DN4074_c0_g1~~TRINITY_DN4074_c0_g1_i1.p1  ORF type:complete len:359 (+),score=44.42 TRINITY_DN4074_c0_g1_i1:147-1223(+)
MVWPQSPVTASLRDIRGSRNIEINSKSVKNEFETDLFKGQVLACIRDVKGEVNPFETLYAGDKRTLCFVVSGKFKQTIKCDDVLCGMQFDSCLKNLPWSVVLSPAEKILTSLSPGSVADLQSERPKLLNFLVTGADVVQTSSEYIDIFENPLTESSPFGGTSPSVRMSLTKSQLSAFAFSTSDYYAFEFWSDKIDLGSFCCNIPGLPRLDLCKYLGSQGYPVTAVCGGVPVWGFFINHNVQFGGVDNDSLVFRKAVPNVKNDDPIPEADSAPVVVHRRRLSSVPPGRPLPAKKNNSIGLPPTICVVTLTIMVLLLWANGTGRVSFSVPNCFARSSDGAKLLDSAVCLGLATVIGYVIA